jgi:hypothetical protein
MTPRAHIWFRVVVAGALAALPAACGELQREGQASSYLIVNTLEGASGAEPDKFGLTLFSDVVTVKDDVASVFADSGKVTFTLAMKDPGSANNPSAPTSANFITLTRYHVQYLRADGRNTPGVDVPYGFDGGLGFTVAADGATGTFEIVRHIAKQESPLAALVSNGVIITTIAEVTFYGHDQTGREVSASARMTIDFGNFADPGK